MSEAEEENSKKLNAGAKAFVPNAAAKEFVPGSFSSSNATNANNNNRTNSDANNVNPAAMYPQGMPAVHGGPAMYVQPTGVPVMMGIPDYGHPAMGVPPFMMDASHQDFMYYGQYMQMNPNAQLMHGPGHDGRGDGRHKKNYNKNNNRYNNRHNNNRDHYQNNMSGQQHFNQAQQQASHAYAQQQAQQQIIKSQQQNQNNNMNQQADNADANQQNQGSGQTQASSSSSTSSFKSQQVPQQNVDSSSSNNNNKDGETTSGTEDVTGVPASATPSTPKLGGWAAIAAKPSVPVTRDDTDGSVGSNSKGSPAWKGNATVDDAASPSSRTSANAANSNENKGKGSTKTSDKDSKSSKNNDNKRADKDGRGKDQGGSKGKSHGDKKSKDQSSPVPANATLWRDMLANKVSSASTTASTRATAAATTTSPATTTSKPSVPTGVAPTTASSDTSTKDEGTDNATSTANTTAPATTGTPSISTTVPVTKDVTSSSAASSNATVPPATAPAPAPAPVTIPSSPPMSARSSIVRDDAAASSWRRPDKEKPLLMQMNGVDRYSKESLLNIYKNVRDEFEEPLLQECPESIISRAEVLAFKLTEHHPRLPTSEHGLDPLRFMRDSSMNWSKPKAMRADRGDDRSHDILIEKVLILLNKMTWDNFEVLKKEFFDLKLVTYNDDGEDTDEDVEYQHESARALVERLTHEVIAKAQMEEPFVEMYARFIRLVIDEWSNEAEMITQEEPKSRLAGKNYGAYLKEELMIRVEEDYGKDREALFKEIEDSDDPIDVKEERVAILKKSYLGHMQFIGELYQQRLIKRSRVHKCIYELLESKEEEKLMCVGKLLTTCGGDLEKLDQQKADPNHSIAGVFDKVDALLSDKTSERKLNSRVRFMFMDLIDLRKQGWEKKLSARGDPQAMKQSELRRVSSNISESGGNRDRRNKKNDSRSLSNSSPSSKSQSGSNTTSDGWNVGTGKGMSKKNSSSGNLNSMSSSNMTETSATSSSSTPSASKGTTTIEALTTSTNTSTEANASNSITNTTSTSDTSNLPGFDGNVDKEILRKVKNSLAEYFNIRDLNEVLTCFSELFHPNGMGDVLKSLMAWILSECKESQKTLFLQFLPHLTTMEPPMLTEETAQEGILEFMNDLEDLMFDAPHAGKDSASIIARLVVSNVIKLNTLARCEFLESYRGCDFIAQILANIISIVSTEEDGPTAGADKALVALKESGIDMKTIGMDIAPKETREEVMKTIQDKHKLPFSLDV